MRLPASRPLRTRFAIGVAWLCAASIVLAMGLSVSPGPFSQVSFIAETHAKNKDKSKRDRDRKGKFDRRDRDDDSGKWQKGRKDDDDWSKNDWSKNDSSRKNDSKDAWSRKSKDDWDQRGGKKDRDDRKDARRQKDKDKDDEPQGAEDPDDTDTPAPTVDRALARGVAPARKQRRAPKVEDFNPDFPSIDQPAEILGTGLGPSDIAAAKGMGFTPVATISAPSLGITATKFRAPSSMGRTVARDMLRTAIPNAGFESSWVHWIHAPADAGEGSGPDSLPEPGPRAGQCRDDRCFGRSAICWTSDAAARVAGTRIGIIDTPVDLDHPAFAGRRISVGSFVGSARRSVRDWHGTAVLSLLAGSMESGVPGLAPDAEYFVAEAFTSDDGDNATTETSYLLEALDWLESQNVVLVNLSFSGPYDALIEKAIARMRKRGVVFVAAAGNLGPTAPPSYPAAYPDVIAVTAVDKANNNYFMAGRGDFVDLSAPGVRVWTALPGGKEGFRTGTSFAAPYVTGLLAAMPQKISGAAAKSHRLKSVRTVDLGPPGMDPIYGRGLAQATASCAGSVAAAPAPAIPAPAATASVRERPVDFGTITVVPAAASAFGP